MPSSFVSAMRFLAIAALITLTGRPAADPSLFEALRRIRVLYAIEDDIRRLELTGEAKTLHRLTHSKPHVETFFA